MFLISKHAPPPIEISLVMGWACLPSFYLVLPTYARTYQPNRLTTYLLPIWGRLYKARLA